MEKLLTGCGTIHKLFASRLKSSFGEKNFSIERQVLELRNLFRNIDLVFEIIV